MEGIKHTKEILIQHFVLLNSNVITHYRTMKKNEHILLLNMYGAEHLLNLMRRQADNMDLNLFALVA